MRAGDNAARPVEPGLVMPEQIEGEDLPHRSRAGFWSMITSEVMDHRHIVPRARGRVLELAGSPAGHYRHYKAEQVEALTILPGAAGGLPVNSEMLETGEFCFPVSAAADFHQLASHSFDCVVSTYYLCREREVHQTLGEIYRVLKPGGQLLFCEPGRHRNGFTALLQDWVTFAGRHALSGRHVNRPFFRLIKSAGFEIDLLERGTRLFHSSVLHHLYCGVALKQQVV